ncbi:MAG TPA: twin-arginine translocase TatA/TatE family subunit, partial [Myxococcaceae bacterium]|nr:twin-arginine translocase TatA/TatE family subunit [Myxococcaceae bacterium]
IVLGFVVVVVFSAARMGALGNALGKFVYAFKKATRGEGFVNGQRTRLHRQVPPEDAEVVEDPKRKKR